MHRAEEVHGHEYEHLLQNRTAAAATVTGSASFLRLPPPSHPHLLTMTVRASQVTKPGRSAVIESQICPLTCEKTIRKAENLRGRALEVRLATSGTSQH